MSADRLATVFPQHFAEALRTASRLPPEVRVIEMNKVIDAMARAGLVRPRSAQGEFLPRGGWDDAVIGDSAEAQ